MRKITPRALGITCIVVVSVLILAPLATRWFQVRQLRTSVVGSDRLVPDAIQYGWSLDAESPLLIYGSIKACDKECPPPSLRCASSDACRPTSLKRLPNGTIQLGTLVLSDPPAKLLLGLDGEFPLSCTATAVRRQHMKALCLDTNGTDFVFYNI